MKIAMPRNLWVRIVLAGTAGLLLVVGMFSLLFHLVDVPFEDTSSVRALAIDFTPTRQETEVQVRRDERIDSAFAAEALIEYSFAEPRFHPQYGGRADPSIQFRHDRTTHAAWCDGHVTPERRTFTWSSGLYSLHPDRFDLGWFGTADDNSVFDLQ